jgi:hypothetical protein
MKIVQSFWSKPGMKNSSNNFADYNKCGWPDKKYNYFSWALSVLQFKKYYPDVELVTDKAGYELLVDKLELPYSSVKIVLDDLNCYHPDLWALGKLYAYSIQDEPFIHADGDVYIWEKFSEEFESSSLLCQHREEGEYFNRVYSTVFMQMLRHFGFYPAVLDASIAKNNSIVAVNAGVLGGSNTSFFKEYTKAAFDFVDKNTDCLHHINIGLSNIVFEQFLFNAMAEENALDINCFKANVNNLLNDFADFTRVPSKVRYIHTPGSLKEQKKLLGALEYRLLTDHPGHYYKIIDLIRTNQI